MIADIDRRVVRNVVSNGEVDPVGLRRKVRSSIGVVLDEVDHIRRADTAAEQNARGAEGACREDNTAFGRQRDNTVGAEGGIVGLDTDNLTAITDDVEHHGVLLVGQVRASNGGLVVWRDCARTLSVGELETR